MLSTQVSTGAMQALEAFYTSTNGAGWDISALSSNIPGHNATWNFAKDEAGDYFEIDQVCVSWMGLSCNGSSIDTMAMGVGNLQGIIPEEMSTLTSLTHLDLNTNRLTGTILAYLGQLTGLTYLDLGTNAFSGTIPMTFGQLTSLSALSLGGNGFAGSIPAAFGQLASLTTCTDTGTVQKRDQIQEIANIAM